MFLRTQEDFDPGWCCQFEQLAVRISKVETKVVVFSSLQFFRLQGKNKWFQRYSMIEAGKKTRQNLSAYIRTNNPTLINSYILW